MPPCHTVPASSLPQRPTVIKAASFLAVWTGLNLLVQMPYPFQTAAIPGILKPSQEIFAALWILCICSWLGVRFSRSLAALLTAATIFTLLFGIADRLVPVYFDRPFNLFIDSRFLPDLISLLHDTMTPGAFMAFSLAGSAGAAIACGFVFWAFRWSQRFFERQPNRTFFMATGNLLLALSLGGVLLAGGPCQYPFSPGVWPRIAQEIGFILDVGKTRRHQTAMLETAMNRMSRLPSSLDRLDGRNVYLLFVESYGQTVFEEPRHFDLVAPVIRRLENDPTLFACSGYLRSPTIAGSSWLAHGTLAGGVMTDTHLKFNLLQGSDIKPLAHYFNRAGYRTVCVMPGTRTPRPEDRWFEFQQKYHAHDMGYQGPAFGWSTMPDQFVLDRICKTEIEAAETPLFIEFILISSHAAFHRQPRLIDDWADIGDGAVYHEMPPRTFPVVWPDLSNAHEAYATAIAYDLAVIEGFLSRCVGPDDLVIVLGDHQPSPQITGDGKSSSVPVHIISRDPAPLAPFLNRGYVPGFIPRHPLPHPGMDTFLEGFLKDFSSR